VVLVDGSNLIFRAFYAIPGSFSTASGLHTNAVYGFALMFRKLFRGKMPELAVVVFDAPGKTFREERYEALRARNCSSPPGNRNATRCSACLSWALMRRGGV